MTDITPAPEGVTPEAEASQVPAGIARSLAHLRFAAVADLVAQLRSQEPADRTTTANILEELNQERAALAADLARQTARADAAERERDAFRAVLEGAGYGDIDGIAKNTPDQSRALGEVVMQLTLAKEARAEAAEAKVARLVEALIPTTERLEEHLFHSNLSGSDPGYEDTIKRIIAKSRAIITEVQG